MMNGGSIFRCPDKIVAGRWLLVVRIYSKQYANVPQCRFQD